SSFMSESQNTTFILRGGRRDMDFLGPFAVLHMHFDDAVLRHQLSHFAFTEITDRSCNLLSPINGVFIWFHFLRVCIPLAEAGGGTAIEHCFIFKKPLDDSR